MTINKPSPAWERIFKQESRPRNQGETKGEKPGKKWGTSTNARPRIARTARGAGNKQAGCRLFAGKALKATLHKLAYPGHQQLRRSVQAKVSLGAAAKCKKRQGARPKATFQQAGGAAVGGREEPVDQDWTQDWTQGLSVCEELRSKK